MLKAEQLEFDFEFGCGLIETTYYREGAEDLIQRLVPRDLLEEDRLRAAEQRARFSECLPFLFFSDLSRAPCTLSVLLLCKYRLNACNFFYDMISRWLLPQKRVNVELFFASDVRLPHLSEDLLSVAEIVIYLKSAQDVEEAKRNIQTIETEIRLGVVSNYHARRILEFKGLSSDGKTAMIQEKIGSLIQSHSKDFDRGIFSQMQQFLVSCPEEFKNAHDYHHMSRMISNLHSLRKLLKQNVLAFPKKRHALCKFIRTQLYPGSPKARPVLGVLVGLNFLSEHEVFETPHLIALIQKQIPGVRLVESSPFLDRGGHLGSFETIYLEVEKEKGGDFGLEEVQRLRAHLPEKVKSHIEELRPAVFMPRNDEEVLKNLAALSSEVRFIHDLPQLTLSFEEQRKEELLFTVILVRLILEGHEGDLGDLFARKKVEFRYIPDRVRKLGIVRKKYIKEGVVFRAALPRKSFLREDHSVDLLKARQYIFFEISRALGEVRDYNGGMIHRQSELLENLKRSLGKMAETHFLLLEKFYHSLLPMEMRTSLSVDSIKQFFLLFLQSAKSDLKSRFRNGNLLFKQEEERVFVALEFADEKEREKAMLKVRELSFLPHELVTFAMELEGNYFFGALLFSEQRDAQNLLLNTLLDETP